MEESKVPAERPRNLLVALIEANILYAASALLVMLGCRLLMQSDTVAGSEFAKAFKSLLILHGYEVLLLGTALVIVRRFKVLGDAGKLFAIELALLFDPTFFSNSFHTMYLSTGSLPQSLGVVAACFVLVPIKLAFLARSLRIRLAPGMWLALLVAAFVVWIAEFLLATSVRHSNIHSVYYFFSWLPFTVACCLPAAKTAGVFMAEEGYTNALQRQRLPRFLLTVPLLVACLHYLESSFVHQVPFGLWHVAPLVLVLAPVLIANGTRGADNFGRLAAIDCLSLLAFLISIPAANEFAKTDRIPLGSPIMPVVAVAATVAALYIAFWLVLKDRRALARLAWGLVLGAGWALFHFGIVAILLDMLASGASWVSATLWSVRVPLLAAAWAGSLVLAIRRQSAGTWLLAGTLAVFLATSLAPQSLDDIFAESFQGLLIATSVVLARFATRRGPERTLIAIAMFVGTVRFAMAKHGYELVGLPAEIVLATVLAVALRDRGHAVLAVCGGLALAACIGGDRLLDASWQSMVLAAGLALFAAAVAVTFAKERLLAWAENAGAQSEASMVASAEVPPVERDTDGTR